MRHFNEFGCTTVVLAFDDKRYVPKAKAITQLKRRVGVQLLPFSDTDVLPAVLPEEWKEAIMSPWFKHRVIELICTNIPRLVTPPQGCKLIVDWETVTEYTYGEETSVLVDIVQESDIGEADLKFTRWMRALQCSMLIEATDGDYIPISLGLKAAGYAQPITIFKAWTAEKGSEFISMEKIYEFIRKKMAASCSRGRQPQCEWWEVRGVVFWWLYSLLMHFSNQIKLFITILGLCGTDFTRNLPLISPQKIWAAMPLVVQTFQMEDTARIHMDQGKRIVELLYAEAFPKHIDSFSRRSVWSQAQVSLLVCFDESASDSFATGLEIGRAQQGPHPHGWEDRVHAQESELPAGVLARIRGPGAHSGLWVQDKRTGCNRVGRLTNWHAPYKS